MSVSRVALILAVLASLAVPPVAADESTRLGFRTAHLSEGRVEFGAPGPIDWRALAPRAWVELDLEDPGEKVLTWLSARNHRGSDFADLEFEASLVEGLAARHFYFFGESGIREVEPSKMKGKVRFGLDRKGALEGRSFLGSVVAAGKTGAIEDPGGFIVDSRRPLVFSESPSSRGSRELVPPEVREKWQGLESTARALWAIESQYTFRVEGEDTEYVFVKWAGDDGCRVHCCRHRYWILAGSETHEQVAWSLGGCDP